MGRTRHGELLAGGESIDWPALSRKLPTARDPETTERRKKLFRDADVNGNGFLSQAEVHLCHNEHTSHGRTR